MGPRVENGLVVAHIFICTKFNFDSQLYSFNCMKGVILSYPKVQALGATYVATCPQIFHSTS